MKTFDLSEYFRINEANPKKGQRRIAVEAALELIKANIMSGLNNQMTMSTRVSSMDCLDIKASKFKPDISRNPKTVEQLVLGEDYEVINPIKNCADMIEEALKVKDA